jgi:hypothetical protein
MAQFVGTLGEVRLQTSEWHGKQEKQTSGQSTLTFHNCIASETLSGRANA